MKRHSTWTASIAWAAAKIGNGFETPSSFPLLNDREEIV